jgi:hypothetical protein
MSVYTKFLRGQGADFDHKFNLKCHEMFNINKVELPLMAYQCNSPPVLFNHSSGSISVVILCKCVCYSKVR